MEEIGDVLRQQSGVFDDYGILFRCIGLKPRPRDSVKCNMYRMYTRKATLFDSLCITSHPSPDVTGIHLLYHTCSVVPSTPAMCPQPPSGTIDYAVLIACCILFRESHRGSGDRPSRHQP